LLRFYSKAHIHDIRNQKVRPSAEILALRQCDTDISEFPYFSVF